jgi:hypothetical protein
MTNSLDKVGRRCAGVQETEGDALDKWPNDKV